MKSRDIETVTVTQYRTSDGLLFATVQSARQHQQVLDITQIFVDDPDFYLPSASPEDVVAWFAEHFTLTPKET